jgi:hypothetical protein
LNSSRDRAFRTILKNRTFHGGILAEGSGLIKDGENGKGILSRWYPETLAKRIRAIASICDRITFIKGDGIQVMLCISSIHPIRFREQTENAPVLGFTRTIR